MDSDASFVDVQPFAHKDFCVCRALPQGGPSGGHLLYIGHARAQLIMLMTGAPPGPLTDRLLRSLHFDF